MPLMDRIRVHPFHEMSIPEKYALIEAIQRKRMNAMETARIANAKGKTRTAANNAKTLAKRKGKKPAKSAEQKALDALKLLTPEQLAALQKRF